MTTKLRPLHDQVLVEPQDNSTTKGGIYIPENARTDGMAERGTVLAVGPGRIDRDGAVVRMSLKSGDIIVHRPYAGNLVEEDGTKLRLMSEQEVLAVENK